MSTKNSKSPAALKVGDSILYFDGVPINSKIAKIIKPTNFYKIIFEDGSIATAFETDTFVLGDLPPEKEV